MAAPGHQAPNAKGAKNMRGKYRFCPCIPCLGAPARPDILRLTPINDFEPRCRLQSGLIWRGGVE